jgi:hypothetical protein
MGYIPLSRAIILTAKETERQEFIERILENPELANLYEDAFSVMLSAFFHNSWILRTLYRLDSSFRLVRKLLGPFKSTALISELRALDESVTTIQARQREIYNSPIRAA